MLQYLAAAGAQVVILTPEPLSPRVVQLLLLLRSTTENERLYAEECDLGDAASVRRFAKGWQKDARGGMVQDLEARIDGVILCDDDDEDDGSVRAPGIGAAAAAAVPNIPAGMSGTSAYGMTRLTGRHALVQLLLPTLLRSASTSASPLRIVNSVSPFYATVTASTFRPDDVEYRAPDAPPYPSSQPWIAHGQVALASILLWREFHLRLKPTGTSAPAAGTAQAPTPTQEEEGSRPSADVADPTPLLALSVCPGLLRSTIRALLRASPSSPSFSVLGCAAYLAVYPLVWLFAKSAEEGAQVVLAALMADVYKEGGEQRQRTAKMARGPDGRLADEGRKRRAPLEEDRPPLLVRPGALYREGLEVR